MRFVTLVWHVRRTSVLAALALAPSCVREPTEPFPSAELFVADVTLATDPSIHGVLTAGYPANFEQSTGTLQVTAPFAVINGGSGQVQVANGGAAFQTIVMFVAGRPDHYVVNLPAPATSASLLVSISPQLKSSFQWVWGVGPNAASASNYTGLNVTHIPVGSGDIQVSVAWDSPADVDLHVLEPGGAEIFWAVDSSDAGGVLDLDSNAACGSDGPRNENITYPGVTPPSGTYIVRVDYWDACGAAATNYVVTIRVAGHAVQTLQDQFTGTGDGGGAGSGVTIGTFSFP